MFNSQGLTKTGSRFSERCTVDYAHRIINDDDDDDSLSLAFH